MATEINKEDIYGKLDAIIGETNIEDVTADSAGYDELQDGYYLCEVEDAELTISKNSGNPMAKFTLKVVENGKKEDVDDAGNFTLREIKGVVNRKLWKYYPFKDSKSFKSFVTDMLKFEGSDGVSVLPREAFTTAEFLEESIHALVGMQIFVHVTSGTDRENKPTSYKNLISWKRATELEL